MRKAWMRAAAALLCLLANVSAQEPQSTHDELPKEGCNDYTLKTIPLDGFHWKQRTCFWSRQLFTASAVFGAAFNAGRAQLTNSPSEWGQGAAGFGRRFGTRYTQGMVKSTVDYLVGGLTGEDPRRKPPQLERLYHPERRGCRAPATPKARIAETLLRPVWDTCEMRPAWGRIAGSFASGFVQLAWAPPSQDHISNAFKGSATAMGGYYGFTILSEFTGDLTGWFGRMLARDKAPPKKGKK